MERNQRISCTKCSHCLIGTYCSPKWISKIDKEKNQLWYKKDQYIFYEGAPVFGIYCITKGKVKIKARVSGNKEQIVRLTSEGYFLGRWGYDNDVYSNSAVTLEDSHICFINNNLLKEACLANPEFSFQLMMYYASELRKAQNRIKLLCQMAVKEKVAETLLYSIEVFGLDKVKNNAIELRRKEIAEIAGTTLEQVSREITTLRKQNVLRTEGKKIMINDLSRLREIVNK